MEKRMSKDADAARRQYEQLAEKGMSLNMERGWPCREQLDLSMPMLDMVTSDSDLCREVDYRGYAGTGGILPARALFAQMLDVSADEIYVGETMSTTLMYDLVGRAMWSGFPGGRPWKEEGGVKLLCPSPGYEKHFQICQYYGIKMIPIRMKQDGPDMEQVEQLAAEDAQVKGIWCVPLYSNPTGTVYSDETIERIAGMKTKADDFKVFWDNAYCVHHLTDHPAAVKNIIKECRRCSHPDRVFEFASTSKITFPGGGVAVCASSEENIRWLTKSRILQLKSGDKINQWRHVLFFKNMDGIYAHMKKHRDIIRPKFDLVDQILHNQLDAWGIAEWTKPRGGYFIHLELKPSMAQAVWEMCSKAGLTLTPAGSTFPYHNDPKDSCLRLAPTYPQLQELEWAAQLIAAAVKCVYTRESFCGKNSR